MDYRGRRFLALVIFDCVCHIVNIYYSSEIVHGYILLCLSFLSLLPACKWISYVPGLKVMHLQWYRKADQVTSMNTYIEARENMQSTANWYVRGHVEILKWFVFASIVYIYLWGIKKIKKHKQLYNLFNFSLLFYAIINILSSIPSVGRFYEVANMLSLAVIFLNLQMIPANYSPWLKRIGVPLLLIFILVKLRFAFDYMGASLVFGNPITAIFIENEIPLIEFIKSLL